MPRAHATSRSAYNKTYQRDRRIELKAKGKCQWCGENDALPSKKDPSVPSSRCAACATKARKVCRDRMSKLRPAWRKLGLCITCGLRDSLRTTSHGALRDTRCAVCADAQDEWKAANRPKINATRNALRERIAS